MMKMLPNEIRLLLANNLDMNKNSGLLLKDKGKGFDKALKWLLFVATISN